jgi:hypothetical protein
MQVPIAATFVICVNESSILKQIIHESLTDERICGIIQAERLPMTVAFSLGKRNNRLYVVSVQAVISFLYDRDDRCF